MTDFLNSLATRSTRQLRHQKSLGLGLTLHKKLRNQPNNRYQLTLESSLDSARPTERKLICIHTKHGNMYFDEQSIESFLNTLSSIPFTPLNAHEPEQLTAQKWYAELYIQQLDPVFLELFGPLFQSPCAHESPESLPAHLISWQSDHSSGQCYVHFDSHALHSLIQSDNWQPKYVYDLEKLTFKVPVSLGSIRLGSITENNARPIQVGDVLLPSDSLFNTLGEGSLHFPTHHIGVRAIENGTTLTFETTHISIQSPDVKTNTTTMDAFYMSNNMQESNFESDSHNLNIQSQDSQSQDSQLQDSQLQNSQLHNSGEHESFSDSDADTIDTTPLTHSPYAHYGNSTIEMSLVAGSVSLTLEELSQLSIGSILVATGESAGHATLYHGTQAVAHGELVNVENRLGLQVTEVYLSPKAQQ